MNKTIDMMRFHAVGLSTWKIFGRHIGDNDLRNMPEYFANPGYEHLHDLWKDKPAVCVAAGPSLQKNLRLLLEPSYRERVIVIAAGTVYGLLHGLGIQPDVVTTIDFQRLNWTDQFAQIPLDAECPLVYLHSTYPQTPRRWPGPRFVAENASDTTTWIRQHAEGKRSAAQVQTVAHLNLMVALEMGANPILLIGQDLSMPRGAHHAPGARAQDMAPDEGPAEAFVETQDFMGQTVWSRHSFLSMKTVFERLALENSGRMIVNCSEAGLPLQGIQNMPLQIVFEMITQLPAETFPEPGDCRKEIKKIFLDYKPQVKDTFKKEFLQLCQWVDDLGVMTKRLVTLADDAEQVTVATLTEAMRQAQLASDVYTLEDTAAQLAIARWQKVSEEEKFLQARHAALALFAIRRFDFLELMGVIPPKLEDFPSELERVKFDAGRVLAVGQMIAEELPTIQQILREVKRRLQSQAYWNEDEDIPSKDTVRLVLREFARERYHLGIEYIKACEPWLKDGIVWRLLAQFYWHTQQYEHASILLGLAGSQSRKMALAAKYQRAWRAATHTALPAYFQQPATVVHAPAGEGYAVYDEGD